MKKSFLLILYVGAVFFIDCIATQFGLKLLLFLVKILNIGLLIFICYLIYQTMKNINTYNSIFKPLLQIVGLTGIALSLFIGQFLFGIYPKIITISFIISAIIFILYLLIELFFEDENDY